MQASDKVFSCQSLSLHTKLVYSFAKTEKALKKLIPLSLSHFSLISHLSKPLWSVNSLFKFTKPLYKTAKNPDKNTTWIKNAENLVRDTLSAFKKCYSIAEILQYNLILLSAYKFVGFAWEVPLSPSFMGELERISFHLTPLKFYRKNVAYRKAENKWMHETNPAKLAARKWDYVQMSLLYVGSSFTCLYWTAYIAHKIFPTLPDPIIADRWLNLAVYSLKFGSIIIKTSSLYIK